MEGRGFEVIGVADRKGRQYMNTHRPDNRLLIIPVTTAEAKLGYRKEAVSRLMLCALPGVGAADSVDAVLASLGPQAGFHPDDGDAVKWFDFAQFLDLVDLFYAGFSVFIGVAGIVTLLIGAVGIANYHLATLSERSVEIAVAKAIGATNRVLIFQTVLEPVIGPDWRKEDKGRAVLPGQWRIEHSPCVTVTNDRAYKSFPEPRKAHARAFMRTLLPQSTEILKVGGEGHELDGLNGKGSSYLWGDFRAKKLTLNDKLAYAGLWSFHVLPKARATRHVFLHAIEATDSTVARPGALELLKCTGGVAAQVGPNVVLFAADDRPLSSATATVAVATTRVVAGNLEAGKPYSVQAGGRMPREAKQPDSPVTPQVEETPGGQSWRDIL